LPSWIRGKCQKQAVESAQSLAKQRADIGEISKEQVAKGMYLKVDYEAYYQNCLRENGLEK
jgi:hypothetical protein